MAKPRSIPEIEKVYNQKLHALGALIWQLEHLIPEQIEQTRASLKEIQRESKQAARVQSLKADEPAEKPLDVPPPVPPSVPEAPQADAQPS